MSYLTAGPYKETYWVVAGQITHISLGIHVLLVYSDTCLVTWHVFGHVTRVAIHSVSV